MSPPRLATRPWKIVWDWVADRTLMINLVAYEHPEGTKIQEVTACRVVSGDTFSLNLELR